MGGKDLQDILQEEAWTISSEQCSPRKQLTLHTCLSF